MAPADWTSTAASAMPSILGTDYDPFTSYDPALHAVYSHAAYGHQGPASSHQANSVSRHPHSPVPSISGPPMAYASAAPVSSRGTVGMKLEAASEYGQVGDLSHCPSPASMHSHYPPEAGVYPHPGSSGYLSDGQTTSWSKTDYLGAEPDHFFLGPSAVVGSPASQDPHQPAPLPRSRRGPRRMTTREEANFQCEVKGCGKLFSRSYNFKAHMETHDEQREYPFPCPVADCDKKFVRKTDLQRHHQSVHVKERNHKCDYCGRLFARKDTLRRHMEDGCSKRFDIGTLDLRSDSYDSLATGARPTGNVHPPPEPLPPLAVPSLDSNNLLAPGSAGRSRPPGGQAPDGDPRVAWPR